MNRKQIIDSWQDEFDELFGVQRDAFYRRYADFGSENPRADADKKWTEMCLFIHNLLQDQLDEVVEMLEGMKIEEFIDMNKEKEYKKMGLYTTQDKVWGHNDALDQAIQKDKGDEMTFNQSAKQKAGEVAVTLAKKQKDYGKNNILGCPVGAEMGIIVRLFDKLNRLSNLYQKGEKPSNESLYDTVLDICGYGLILMMLQDGSFQLPLED